MWCRGSWAALRPLSRWTIDIFKADVQAPLRSKDDQQLCHVGRDGLVFALVMADVALGASDPNSQRRLGRPETLACKFALVHQYIVALLLQKVKRPFDLQEQAVALSSTNEFTE